MVVEGVPKALFLIATTPGCRGGRYSFSWMDPLSLDIYIYIYIVIHRQTVSFYRNSSVWLDTQDARSLDRNPSNFTLD